MTVLLINMICLPRPRRVQFRAKMVRRLQMEPSPWMNRPNGSRRLGGPQDLVKEVLQRPRRPKASWIIKLSWRANSTTNFMVVSSTISMGDLALRGCERGRLVSQHGRHRLCLPRILGRRITRWWPWLGLHSHGLLRNLLPHINSSSASKFSRRCQSGDGKGSIRDGQRKPRMD